ncbi:nickel insertion protein [Sinorhizobium garamanticum]|uniref:nickel insertion protein n=1 Tax=Sinorhizobium garamanticum TaxID=680247 RepID=UPI003CC8A426
MRRRKFTRAPPYNDHGALAPNHGTISVPAPRSVKISSRTEWAVLPFRMTTPCTPALMASMQVSTFGIMPPEIVPSAISARA